MSKRKKKLNIPAELWKKQIALLGTKIQRLNKEIKLGWSLKDNVAVNVEAKRAEKEEALRLLAHLEKLGVREGYTMRKFPNLKNKGTKRPDLPYGGGYSDRGPEWLRNWR